MMVSLDNVHSPWSMNRLNRAKVPPDIAIFDLKIDQNDPSIQCEWIQFEPPLHQHDGFITSGSFDDIASKLPDTLQSEDVYHEIEISAPTKSKSLYSSLGEFLYGLENLRKKNRIEGDGEQTGEGIEIPSEVR